MNTLGSDPTFGHELSRLFSYEAGCLGMPKMPPQRARFRTKIAVFTLANAQKNVRMSDLTPRFIVAALAPEREPKPVPPPPPGPDDCCHSGCTWCVFDLYQEELERYQQELKEWEARHKAPKR
jgi:hypothetical protein